MARLVPFYGKDSQHTKPSYQTRASTTFFILEGSWKIAPLWGSEYLQRPSTHHLINVTIPFRKTGFPSRVFPLIIYILKPFPDLKYVIT